MDSAQDLGRLLGNMSNRIATLESNVYPDDPSAQLQVLLSESITFSESGIITSRVYSTDSFILDHPVYGELDSSILSLDGGYSSSSIVGSF